MNFPLLNEVLDSSSLTSSQRLVLIIMLNHAGDTGKAWPSQATIARQAALTERSVNTMIGELRHQGWLIRVGSVGRTGVFKVAVPETISGSQEATSGLNESGKPEIISGHHEMVSADHEMVSCPSRNGFVLTTQEPLIEPPKNHPSIPSEIPLASVQEVLPPPKAKSKAWTPDQGQQTVNRWFGRRATTAWSAKEQRAWKDLPAEAKEDGLRILEPVYTATDGRGFTYRRKNVETLLNNWQGEIDRWRDYKAPTQSDVRPLQKGYEDPPFLTDDAAIYRPRQGNQRPRYTAYDPAEESRKPTDELLKFPFQ